MYDCHWTDWRNHWDEKFLFSQQGQVIAGMESEHSNEAEDRRFKYYLCKLRIGKIH